MNVEQQHNRSPGDKADAHKMGLGGGPAWSALVDGALNATDIEALLLSIDDSPEALSDWHAYQVIGDVLRGNADPTGTSAANDFLAAVRIGINACDTATLAQALRPPMSSTPVIHGRGQAAANEAVFRWKLVAGIASFAAVMAVSWTMLFGSGAGSIGSAGAELAVAPTSNMTEPASAATAAVSPGPAAVTLGTGQGVLIRDAQLEALLAEHRQHGGMSALQMPSGFIRNATYEAAGR